MDRILSTVTLIACAYLAMGCICRLDMLRAGINRVAVIVMYTLSALFAFGVALDVFHERMVDWWEIAGVIAFALHLHVSRSHWIGGAPASTLRGSSAKEPA